MNPFSYGTIVRGDNFYDRKEEKERIISTLLGGNNLVLFAPRRYGKTSLVFKAIEELERQGIDCIYFDMMPVYSLESFVILFLQAIEKKQTKIEQFVKTISTCLKNIRPKLVFDNSGKPEFSIDFVEDKVSIRTVAELLDLPEKLTRKGQRTIVIFDEFQEITKFDKYGFENLLRSKIQQQQNVNYLFLGSKTHILTDMFTNKKKPFYNSALNMQISTLPERETINFLQRKFSENKIEIEEKECVYLIEKTTNIPYYIQLLSSEVWQYTITTKEKVSKEIIDICIKRIVELKYDYYYELFDKHSVMQKKLLKALTISGENIFSAEYLKTNRLSASSTVQKSVSILMDSGLVDKSSNKYFISDPFFQLYIQNYA
jgi:uncharacterized protein